MKDLGRNISCVTRRGPVDHTGYTVGIDFVWVSYVKKYQVCSRRARVWAKLSLQESAKLIHMVLTVLCARSSCREAVAREKRSKKQNDRIGHLVNLIKFWSIWFEDGCLQQGAASGCNRHREQNNRCTLINRVKLYSVRVRDITFWHQSSLALLDIHSSLLEFYFRILYTERTSPLPLPLFPTRQIKRLGYRGAWVRILNTEETSATLSTHATYRGRKAVQ